MKIRFPSVYSFYFDAIQGEIFVFYEGEKNEKLTKEIRDFLKERVSPLMPITVGCSQKQLRFEEVMAIATVTRKGGDNAF